MPYVIELKSNRKLFFIRVRIEIGQNDPEKICEISEISDNGSNSFKRSNSKGGPDVNA